MALVSFCIRFTFLSLSLGACSLRMNRPEEAGGVGGSPPGPADTAAQGKKEEEKKKKGEMFRRIPISSFSISVIGQAARVAVA